MKLSIFGCAAAAASFVVAGAATMHAADPWADRVVSYAAGDLSGPTEQPDFVTNQPYNDPTTALGSPTRIASPDFFPAAVTPLAPAFRANEVVSIGYGGSLVVQFDEPVADDPLNPFGIDLLVFGNALFIGNFFNPDFSFNAAGTVAAVGSEGGIVEVSADGMNFLPASVVADGLFPTNAYVDAADPFGGVPGTIASDFTLPVDPTFNPIGKTYAQILAGYGASGGGLGIDIAPTGLASISYVRITNPIGSAAVPEIDALADVRAIPEPGAAGLALLALILLGKTALSGKVNVAWLRSDEMCSL